MRDSPGPAPLSVVIPTHDTRELALEAVASVALHASAGTEIIVVDDGSSDGTHRALTERWPEITILRNSKALGFSASANRGLAQAEGRILLLLNSDASLNPGSLSPLLQAFERDDRLGIAGASLKYPDGSPQWSGGAFPSLPWLFALTSGAASLAATLPFYRHVKKPGTSSNRRVQWVTGAAMALRRQVWDDLGPLDEGYRFYGQDLDLCRKASEAGWGIALLHDCVVTHHHGATIGTTQGAAGPANPEYLWTDILRFVDRHDGGRAARRARWIMTAGVGIRLGIMALVSPFRSATAREALRDRRKIFRRAKEALRSNRSASSFGA